MFAQGEHQIGESTMARLGYFDFELIGGPGGVGLSRQHFQRIDLGVITPTDAAAAAAAYRGLWFTAGTYMPDDITVSVASPCAVVDDATGAPITEVAPSSFPAAVVGSVSTGWAAGVGCRINLGTANVINRRFVRGAIFIVPLAGSAFDTNGFVSTGPVGAIAGAAATYAAAMTAAGLNHIVWHRPAKGTHVGGVAAPVLTVSVKPGAAVLRSRRT
jgi:hypothetical protein